MENGFYHPTAVHFVIALYLMAFAADFIFFSSKNEKWEWMSSVLYYIAAIFSLMAVATGLYAEEQAVFPKASIQVFSLHETYAFLFTVLVLAIAFWRFLNKNKIPSNLRIWYKITIIVGVFLLISTGYFGGRLVYSHGVGVQLKKNTEPELEIKKKPDKFEFDKTE